MFTDSIETVYNCSGYVLFVFKQLFIRLCRQFFLYVLFCFVVQ